MAGFLSFIFKADSTELEAAEKSVDQLKDKVKDLAGEIPGLGGAFSLFFNTLKEGKELFEDLEAAVGRLPAVLITATVAAVGLGVALAFKYAEIIENIDDLSEAYGYSATQILLMKQAAENAGSSLSAVEGAYSKVAKAAYTASDANKGTGAAFAELGISIKDSNGELKSAQELTAEAAEAWENGSQTTADFAAMNTILGKSWQQQLPAIQEVNEANKLAADLASQGIGISTESSAVIKANTAANLEFTGVMSDVGSRMTQIVIPAFTNLVTWLSKSYESGGLVAGVFGVIEVATATLMVAIKGVIGVFETLDFLVTLVGKGVGALFASFALAMNGEFAAAGNVFVEYFNDGVKAAQTLQKSIDNLVSKPGAGFGDQTIAGNKPGNSNHAGGDTRPSTKKITNATGSAPDVYKPYLDSLQKMIDSQNMLNASEKAETEIRQLNATWAQKEADIEAHNAAVKAAGTGQLQAQMDPSKQAAEIAAIRAEAAALDDAHAKKQIEVTDYNSLNKMVNDYTIGITKELNQRTMTAEQVQLQNEIDKITLDTQTKINALDQEHLLTDDRKNQLLAQQTVAIQQVTAATQKLVDANADWVTTGIDKFIKGAGTMNDALANLVSKGLNGFTDALTNLINGKGGFTSFVTSMLTEIEKLVIQYTIIIPLVKAFKDASTAGGGISGFLGSILGGAAGGSATPDLSKVGAGVTYEALGGVFAGGVKMYASGGVFDSPTAFGTAGGMGVMGEAGPEAVMPLTRGADGKLGVKSSGSAGTAISIQVPINVTFTGDAGSTDDQNTAASKIGATVTAAVYQVLYKEIRPLGLLNPSGSLGR